VTRRLWHLVMNFSSKFSIGFTNIFIAFSVASVTIDITCLDNFTDNLKNLKELKFNSNNQPDTTVSQVYYLTFMCRSTWFGRLHTHHQELTIALTASGFTFERGGSSAVGRGLATGQTTTNSRLCKS
jgi:hypothetical protein